MRFFNKVYRDNTVVKIDIDSGLGTCTPIYPFSFGCGNQETAQLLANHLREQIEKFKKSIAKEPYYHLKPEEISKLKMELINGWNARDHCWK